MILEMKNKHYFLTALALLNIFSSTISAQEVEEQNELSDLIAEDTAEVNSRIEGIGERMKRSNAMDQADSAEDISNIEGTGARMKRSNDMFTEEDSAENIANIERTGARIKRSDEILHNLIDELVKEGADVTLDESSNKIPHRAQRSITRVKRLLDNLDVSKRKRSSDKDMKNQLAVKKRNSNKEKKHKESKIVDTEEDEAGKRKIKRRAKDEMKRINSKKGKKRSSKEKKHVGARCTEPSACNACQTTTEEFTLPTTTESECCETKPKCKPTTTKCRTTTTPCDPCDTCRLKDEDETNQDA